MKVKNMQRQIKFLICSLCNVKNEIRIINKHSLLTIKHLDYILFWSTLYPQQPLVSTH